MPKHREGTLTTKWTDHSSKICIQKIGDNWAMHNTGVKKDVYERIMKELENEGLIKATGDRIRDKWRGLVKTYNGIMARPSSISEKSQNWRHFDQMHRILGNSVSVKVEANPLDYDSDQPDSAAGDDDDDDDEPASFRAKRARHRSPADSGYKQRKTDMIANLIEVQRELVAQQTRIGDALIEYMARQP